MTNPGSTAEFRVASWRVDLSLTQGLVWMPARQLQRLQGRRRPVRPRVRLGQRRLRRPEDLPRPVVRRPGQQPAGPRRAFGDPGVNLGWERHAADPADGHRERRPRRQQDAHRGLRAVQQLRDVRSTRRSPGVSSTAARRSPRRGCTARRATRRTRSPSRWRSTRCKTDGQPEHDHVHLVERAGHRRQRQHRPGQRPDRSVGASRVRDSCLTQPVRCSSCRRAGCSPPTGRCTRRSCAGSPSTASWSTRRALLRRGPSVVDLRRPGGDPRRGRHRGVVRSRRPHGGWRGALRSAGDLGRARRARRAWLASPAATGSTSCTARRRCATRSSATPSPGRAAPPWWCTCTSRSGRGSAARHVG